MRSTQIIYVLLLFTAALHTQQCFSQITGKVIACDNKPLGGAVVRTLKTGLFTITGDDGKFRINLNTGDTLSISCVGYESVALPQSKISSTIKLPCKVKIEDEVVIYKFKEKSNIGIRRGGKSVFVNTAPGDEHCIYILNTVNKICRARSVSFSIKERISDTATALLIGFREVDSTTGLPGRLIGNEPQIIRAPFSKNVSIKFDHPILLPAKEFFISITTLAQFDAPTNSRPYYVGTTNPSARSNALWQANRHNPRIGPYFLFEPDLVVYASVGIEY